MADKRTEGETYYLNYFKKLYESWEKSMSNALELWLKSPASAASAQSAVKKAQEFKDYMYEIMERTLKNKYLPMKNDFDRIAESLDNLEDKLSRLSERIEDIETLKVKEPAKKSRKGSKSTEAKTAKKTKANLEQAKPAAAKPKSKAKTPKTRRKSE
ncbi:MAG: hypothetical protein IH874_01535 [Candidatus Dadabacteria bacterium]|nr:hypothetical protein [Candidatus Dadabacteria bacterium]